MNHQFTAASQAASRKVKSTSKPIVSDIWQSLKMDQYLSDKGIALRKATGKMMDDIYSDLLPYVEKAEFPSWLPNKIKELGINGL